MSACRGASGSPGGGGMCWTTPSRTSSMPRPSLALANTHSEMSTASVSSISSMTRSGSAAGRSILLMTGRIAKIVIHGQAHVGQGLRLDPLRGVHHQDGSLAGRQTARHLVGEVHVTGRVDEVQLVIEAVRGPVGQSNRGHLDGDSPLPLQLHLVQDLFPHLPGIHGVGRLQQPVGQSRLPVVDVGDDAEVPDPGLGHGDILRSSPGAIRDVDRYGWLL